MNGLMGKNHIEVKGSDGNNIPDFSEKAKESHGIAEFDNAKDFSDISNYTVSFQGGHYAEALKSPNFDISNMTPEYLKNLLDEQAASLHLPSLDLTTSQEGNASWHRYGGREWINVNHDWLSNAVQIHGKDIISTSLGHEFGHHLMEKFQTDKLLPKISDWHHELGADFVSGVIAAREGINIDAARHFMKYDAICPSISHPDGILRTGALQMGYDWGKQNLQEFSHDDKRNGNPIHQFVERSKIQQALVGEIDKLIQNTSYIQS